MNCEIQKEKPKLKWHEKEIIIKINLKILSYPLFLTIGYGMGKYL